MKDEHAEGRSAPDHGRYAPKGAFQIRGGTGSLATPRADVGVGLVAEAVASREAEAPARAEFDGGAHVEVLRPELDRARPRRSGRATSPSRGPASPGRTSRAASPFRPRRVPSARPGRRGRGGGASRELRPQVGTREVGQLAQRRARHGHRRRDRADLADQEGAAEPHRLGFGTEGRRGARRRDSNGRRSGRSPRSGAGPGRAPRSGAAPHGSWSCQSQTVTVGVRRSGR